MFDIYFYIAMSFNILTCIAFIYYCMVQFIEIRKERKNDADHKLIFDLLQKNSELIKQNEKLQKQNEDLNNTLNNMGA